MLDKEYEKIGLSVSDEELYDIMVDHPHPVLVRQLTDQQTGQANPRFADPVTGQLSPAKLREFTQTMTDKDEESWLELEDYIRGIRLSEKYNNLVKKGMYVTTAVSKRNYTAQNTSASVKYIVKNFSTVADSTIKPTDDELDAYYNAHQNEFKQETSRKVEYVAFDISPSQEDFDVTMEAAQKIAEEFKTVTDDSSYVISESDSRTFDETFHAKGTLSPEIDTLMFKSPVGTVVGPYLENGSYKISKLIKEKTAADSAKVRHILIAYKGSGASETTTLTKEQSKKVADSLAALIKKGGAKFADLVEKHSDDSGKKMPPTKKPGEEYPGKGGDYGWLNATSGFVPSFKDAGLDNKKGVN